MATFAIARPKKVTGGNRGWEIAVWVGQVALAALLAVVGVMRLFMPLAAMHERLAWVDPSNDWWLRLTGFTLLCMAAALVLPPLLKLSMRLVPATAIAMALFMVASVASHLIRGRGLLALRDFGVIALCVFVAWGRTRRLPY